MATVLPQNAGLSAIPICSLVSWKSVRRAASASPRMEKAIAVVLNARQLMKKSRPLFTGKRLSLFTIFFVQLLGQILRTTHGESGDGRVGFCHPPVTKALPSTTKRFL